MKKTIAILLAYEPFMACLYLRCTQRWTDLVPTAGVRILPDGVIELLINPEFFYLQSESTRVGLIWHEMYHLTSGHIEGSYGLDPDAANIAMDEAINQLIPQGFLPKNGILPEYFRHERGKSYEYYYNLHRQSKQDLTKYQQKQKYEGGIDDEKNKQDLKEQIKDLLKKQKEIQDQQESLQSEQETQSAQNNKPQDSEKKSENEKKNLESQKAISKKEDQIEDKQESLSEQMANNGMKESAEQSDELSDRQKDLRKQMEKTLSNYDKNPSSDPEVQKQQNEMKNLQDQQQDLQNSIGEALDKLEDINKQQKERSEKKKKSKGQKGSPGAPGSGEGSGDGESGDEEGDESEGEGQGPGGPGEETPEVMDQHDMWHTSPASQEEQKKSLNNILSQAIADAERQFGYDSIPKDLREMMAKTMEKPKIKWSTAFKNYVGRCLINDQVYSRKKPNRRFGYDMPGKAQKFGPKVIIANDCSGSVSDLEYSEFMQEASGIGAEFSEKIEVIFFDTKVFDQKFMLDAGTKKLPPRPLAGGTDFQCVIDYAEQKKPDLLIILTDGAAPTPTKPKFPVMWVICGGKDNENLFGKRVLLELDNNRQNSKFLGE